MVVSQRLPAGFERFTKQCSGLGKFPFSTQQQTKVLQRADRGGMFIPVNLPA